MCVGGWPTENVLLSKIKSSVNNLKKAQGDSAGGKVKKKGRKRS